MIIAEDMRMMLESLDYEVVGIALDFEEAVELLDNSKPDIILSDIALGGQKDGIDLAELVLEKYRLPFIFVTSHSDKTTLERAKSVKPNGYLVKPFEQKDLYTSIEIAMANFGGYDSEATQNEETGFIVNDAIYVKDGHALVKIFLKDLIWIKSEGNYIELHQTERRNVIRSTMQVFMAKMPEIFFRVHKSYAINLTRIDAIDGLNVKLGEEVIPVGLGYKDELISRLKTA